MLTLVQMSTTKETNCNVSFLFVHLANKMVRLQRSNNHEWHLLRGFPLPFCYALRSFCGWWCYFRGLLYYKNLLKICIKNMQFVMFPRTSRVYNGAVGNFLYNFVIFMIAKFQKKKCFFKCSLVDHDRQTEKTNNVFQTI